MADELHLQYRVVCMRWGSVKAHADHVHERSSAERAHQTLDDLNDRPVDVHDCAPWRIEARVVGAWEPLADAEDQHRAIERVWYPSGPVVTQEGMFT